MAERSDRIPVVARSFLAIAIPVVVYSLSFAPPLYMSMLLIRWFNPRNYIHFFLLPILVFLNFLFTLVTVTLISGSFAWLFKRKINEGEYEITLGDKTVFRYALYCIFYRTPLKILNIINFLPLRYALLRLAGLKMGKNCRLMGNELIEDPFVTEIGDNTLIGGYTIITAHLIEEKLKISKIKIGSNCLIGGAAFIMPGVIIEDNVTVGAMSLVPKNKVLRRNRIYVGIPVREIGERQ